MSLTTYTDEPRFNPLDVVERLAAGNDWSFERASEDEITILVTGRWVWSAGFYEGAQRPPPPRAENPGVAPGPGAMWLQGYYSVASAETGRLSLRISDPTGTISLVGSSMISIGGSNTSARAIATD